ncbi:MAG: hypothetical protein ABSC90_11635 [Acidimicrobiales bacterium]
MTAVSVAMLGGVLIVAAFATDASAATTSSALARATKLEQVVNSAVTSGVPGAVKKSHGAITPISCLPDIRANFSGPLHYSLTEHVVLPVHDPGPSAIRRIGKTLRSHFTVKLAMTKDSATVQAPSNAALEGKGMFVVVLWSKTTNPREVKAVLQSACDVPG